MERTLKLYPWYQGISELIFWQAVWFLYFKDALSIEFAILLMAIYDITVVILEVPTGYISDRFGRRISLAAASLVGCVACIFLFVGSALWVFVVGQIMMGLSRALQSGSDSALLYDALKSLNRENEVALHETRSFRFRFIGLALSAVSGGFLAQFSMPAVFLATAVTMFLAFGAALLMREPQNAEGSATAAAPLAQMTLVWKCMSDRVLLWMFLFVVIGYIIGHVPFVFGQPYVEETLALFDASDKAPAAVGILTAAMMFLSVLASLTAPKVRARLGLIGCFVMGRGIQIFLVGAMAFLVHPAVALLIVIRMVPDAFTQPYIMEVIQPRIESGIRATYLSMQSLVTRLLFSATLFTASAATAAGAGTHDVLAAYFWGGGVIIAGLVLTSGILRGVHRPSSTTSP